MNKCKTMYASLAAMFVATLSAFATATPFELAVQAVETEILGAITFVLPIIGTIAAAALSLWLVVRAVRWVRGAAR